MSNTARSAGPTKEEREWVQYTRAESILLAERRTVLMERARIVGDLIQNYRRRHLPHNEEWAHKLDSKLAMEKAAVEICDARLTTIDAKIAVEKAKRTKTVGKSVASASSLGRSSSFSTPHDFGTTRGVWM